MNDAQLQLRLAAYKAALHRFDWQFNWIDDGAAYQRARDKFEALRREATLIDPGWSLWNTICAPQFVNGKQATT